MARSISDKKTRTLLYAFGLALLFMIGLSLIFVAAWRRGHSSNKVAEEIVGNVERERPGMTYAQSRAIKKHVETWLSRMPAEAYGEILARDLGIAFIIAVVLT